MPNSPDCVLIVDDIPLNLDLLEARLGAAGYATVSARNGQQALQLLSEHPIALIVSDILMPEMDGYQLCRHCKSNAQLRLIPFIFYTATYTDQKDREFALQLGADGFLVKPCDKTEFFALIEKLLFRWQSANEWTPSVPSITKTGYLEQHNDRLIAKLSRKIWQLEQAQLAQAELQLRVQQQAQKNIQRLESMLELSRYRAKDEQSLLDFALRQALTLTDSTVARLLLLEQSTGRMVLRASVHSEKGMCDTDCHHPSCPMGEIGRWRDSAHPKDTVVHNGAVIAVDGHETPCVSQERKAPKNFLIAPVVRDGKVVAVVSVGGAEKGYSELDEKQLGVLVDEAWRVLEQRSAELERGRLTTAIEQAHEGIGLLSKEGTFTYANRAMLELLGRREEYPPRPSLYQAEQGAVLLSENEVIGQAFADERTWSGRVRHSSADGTAVECDDTLAPVRDEQGRAISFVYTSRDVTEKLKLESRLQVAEKMSAIGTLAGGIAHDFNNILTGIIGLAELALEDVSDRPPTASGLSELLGACDRAKALIGQILAFSQKAEHQRRPMHLLPIVNEVCTLLRASLSTSITIQQSVGSDSDLIVGDPNQIHQLLMNLCTNAHQAMLEHGGIISIKLNEMVLSAGDLENHPSLSAGRHLVLSVRDSGSGIPREDLSRIFDPYFTNRPKTTGTGLGLAIAHGIVLRHRGEISVSSEPGVGTLFEVLLPLVDGGGRMETSSAAPKTSGGIERILVVDDEPMITTVTQRHLELLGYRVTIARGAKEAISSFESAADGFDLVITDKCMPDGTGFDVCAAIRALRPAIPIILCSGYLDEDDVKRAAADDIDRVLAKPVARSELAVCVRGVLDRRATR